MRRFGLAALQLELGPGNNMDVIAAEIASASRRFPWIDMVMLAELASHGVSLDAAEPLPGPHRAALPGDRAQAWAVAAARARSTSGPATRIYNTAPVIDPRQARSSPATGRSIRSSRMK